MDELAREFAETHDEEIKAEIEELSLRLATLRSRRMTNTQGKQFGPFEVLNPNKAWCVKEVDNLLNEWRLSAKVVDQLRDSPEYNPKTCTEAIKRADVASERAFGVSCNQTGVKESPR